MPIFSLIVTLTFDKSWRVCFTVFALIKENRDDLMPLSLRKPLMLAAIFALAACGGGGGGDDDGGGGGGGGGGGPPVLGEINDTATISQSTRAANFQIGSGASIAQAVSITLDAGFLTRIDGSVRIFGETVSISNGRGTLNGQDVRVEIDRSSAGAFAVPVSVVSYGPNLINPADPGGETGFVAGFETNASVLNARPDGGSVAYTGGFAALGVLQDGGVSQNNELEGDIVVNVSFGASDTASVTIDGNSQNSIGGSTSVDLSLASAPISGNGFGGGLTCAGGGCDGTGSAIDATFYGPDAEEVGGVIAVNITRGGDTFEGVGTFVIGQ